MSNTTNLNKPVILVALCIGAIMAACVIAWAIREPNGAVDPAGPPSQSKPYQLLKFSGSWCLSCRTLASRLRGRDVQRVLTAFKVKEIDVDIDKEPKTAEAWGVTTVPVIILVEIDKYGKGIIVRRHVGSLSTKDLLVFVDPSKEFTEPE